MSLELSYLVISPKDLSKINSTLFWRIIFCILIDFDLHYLHDLWCMNKSSLLSLRTNRPFFLSNLFLPRDLLRINSTLLWRIIFWRLIEYELHDQHEQIVPSLVKLVLYVMCSQQSQIKNKVLYNTVFGCSHFFGQLCIILFQGYCWQIIVWHRRFTLFCMSIYAYKKHNDTWLQWPKAINSKFCKL